MAYYLLNCFADTHVDKTDTQSSCNIHIKHLDRYGTKRTDRGHHRQHVPHY